MSQKHMLALLLDDHLKEEACMKYINAKDLLPDALVRELQNYLHRYRPSAKSYIRNKPAGVAGMQPLLFVGYRSIRYRLVDGKVFGSAV